MSENSILFQAVQNIAQTRILCVGDVMLDRFVYGVIKRISPEAPVPVLLVDREKHMLGGAGNVAANVSALGAKPVLVAVTGNDDEGGEIEAKLSGIGAEGTIIAEDSRQTTVKSRFICGGQQTLRVDREHTHPLSAATEDKVIAAVKSYLAGIDAIILSDYSKGTLTDRVVKEVIAAARAAGKIVVVDPKGQNFRRYAGATVITPNRQELEAATGFSAATDDEARAACMKIIADCGIETVLATRGRDGLSLISEKDDPVHIPAKAREVFDVSGAGDTTIAAFAACLATGTAAKNAAAIANIAGSISVGKTGTATVRPDEIERILESGAHPKERHLHARGSKLVTLAEAAEQAERWRARGFKVGFTNGCFDLLHPGHVSTIRQAKAACDFLIVGANTDESVRRLKGPTRPVQSESERATLLSALEAVDLVVLFGYESDNDTPVECLKAIKPDALVKGGQYKLEEVVGYEIVMSYGGRIVRAEMEEGLSTTNTIKKMAS